MKKTLCTVFCVLLTASMLLTLSGCGTSGRYVLTNLSYDGINVSAEEANIQPNEYYIEMKANGTAVMCVDGDVVDMLWKDGQIWASDEEDSKADFTIDGDVLTVDVDGIEMIFEKE